jgi:YesN/AraC family two-component response regulator
MLDLNMYPLGGIDVLREIAQTKFAAESLLVMVSGIADIKLVREGYQLGAKTFLIKPLTQEDVMSFLVSAKDRIQVETSHEGNALQWVSANSSRVPAPDPRQTGRILSMGA